MSFQSGESGAALKLVGTFTKVIEHEISGHVFQGLKEDESVELLWQEEITDNEGGKCMIVQMWMEKRLLPQGKRLLLIVRTEVDKTKWAKRNYRYEKFKFALSVDGYKDSDSGVHEGDIEDGKQDRCIGDAYQIPSSDQVFRSKFTLTLNFFKWVENEGKPQSEPNLSPALEPMDREKLSDLSDVTVTAGDQSFQCHKVQLASRSDVLAAMFSHNMKENSNGEVRINDFEADTVNDFINFMYEGKVDDTAQYNLNLLRIADKYNVQVLKRRCEEYLSYNLDDSNVMTCWITSDRNNAAYLKVRALSYIIQNWDKKEGFADYADICMNNPGLLLELMKVKK